MEYIYTPKGVCSMQMIFEIDKGRLSSRITAPYTEERRKVSSECAKSHGLNLINGEF